MSSLQRLDKILANMGFGSRKEVKALIKDGYVEVDGEVITEAKEKINAENQLIKVNGIILNYRKYVYIMMNKPQGVISATEDYKHETLLDLLDMEYSYLKLHPVGRLDRDTEGLILLTNDGQLTHDLTSPKKGVPKKYYAEISGIVDDEDVESFKNGIVLDDGYKTLPSDLEIIEKSRLSKIMLTIYEGRYHQVKRMFEAVSKKVIYLKRLSIGPLELDKSLGLGKYRELTEKELSDLQKYIEA